jgi:ribonuclease HII
MSDRPFVIGCDEVGYGAWSGPVVVVGVRAPQDWKLEGLNDSKKLSPKQREAMADKMNDLIVDGSITWALAERSNVFIDKVGLGAALKDAYVEVFHQLYQPDSIIISDGTLKFDGLGVDGYTKVSMIKADTIVPQVMAASILAKVYRDGKMKILHNLHPMYGWKSNVGYGAKTHLEAIKKYGLSPLHRHSYKIKGL